MYSIGKFAKLIGYGVVYLTIERFNTELIVVQVNGYQVPCK
jgi:hypothetical protein